MRRMFFSIQDAINLDRWQATQDAISKAIGLAIITVDYKGIAVSEHSGCQDFCRNVRKNEEMLELCQKCDSRGGLEAVRANGPYIYSCHFDIVDIAIPITVEDKYLGAIMAGQARFVRKEERDMLEKIAINYDVGKSEAFLKMYSEDYRRLPVFTYDQIRVYTEMLKAICDYIVGESVRENYGKVAKANETQKESVHESILGKYRFKTNILDTVLDGKLTKAKNTRLQTIFTYLDENKNEQVTLAQMAILSHMNENYLSRIFKKETGKSFTEYVNYLNMHWAKELLTKTEMPILAISEELGYADSGYFAKRFKKYEGMTPTEYRKYFDRE